jgi:sirohydrochlorin ferrochelatase
MNPILIACSHGTRNAEGAAAIARLRDRIRALRPGLDVREAYVDVQEPSLPDVVARLPEGAPVVVVPLLLSVGYHVRVDIATAVADRPLTVAAKPLGPDVRLAQLLQRRLEEAGAAEDDGVVLAAAGSSDPAAAGDVERMAEYLRALRTGTVAVGYGASAEPAVADAVRAVATSSTGAEGPGRTAIASYLLAPGYFHDQLAKAGADVVSAALLPAAAQAADDTVARIALERFDEAAAFLSGISAEVKGTGNMTENEGT